MLPTGWVGTAGDALSGRTATVFQAQVDPAALLDASPLVRALGSFLLVALFGGAVLYWREDLVNRAVESSMDSPAVSVVYGTMAYVLVTFLVGYGFSQLGQLGVGGDLLPVAGLVVGGSAFLLLGGLGYVVVGGRLTEIWGRRRTWSGLVVGAVISGIALALPGLVGVAAWVGIAAVGIGGPTRTYIHDSRSVESEA